MTVDPTAMKRLALLAAAGTLLFALAGCFNPFSPLVSRIGGISSPAPVPNTPANCVRLHEWCWKNRAAEEYRELFTDDYVFVFGLNDSAGQPYRDRPWIREDELTTATNAFVGGGDVPPANKITINYDPNLITFADVRPGKTNKWHRTIRTSVDLQVDAGERGTLEVKGNALFFMIRGDSANIPPELVARGFKRDSTRWWIERWEDETLSEGAALRPASPPEGFGPVARTSMGRLKEYWR